MVLVLAVMHVATRMPAFFGDNMVLQTRSRGGDRDFLSGWLRADDPVAAASLAATSSLCLQAAAEFSQLTLRGNGAIGPVTAVKGSTLQDWVPQGACARWLPRRR